jgi:hypothetical protein
VRAMLCLAPHERLVTCLPCRSSTQRGTADMPDTLPSPSCPSLRPSGTQMIYVSPYTHTHHSKRDTRDTRDTHDTHHETWALVKGTHRQRR